MAKGDKRTDGVLLSILHGNATCAKDDMFTFISNFHFISFQSLK